MAFLQSLKSGAERFQKTTALLLGVCVTLGFAPFGFWPLALLALAGLFVLLKEKTWQRSLLLGWLFATGHFVSGIYWIFISTHVFGGAPAVLGVLLTLALSAGYMAPWLGMAMGLASWLRLWKRAIGWLVVPALWLLAELARGHLIFDGFAWLSLGDIALDTPLQRLVPLIGVHGVSALLLIMSFALFQLITASRPQRIFATAILLSSGIAFLLPSPEHWTQTVGKPLDVAIIQGNVPQQLKWQPEMDAETMLRYRGMTLQERDADLIIWPEAPLTQTYDMVKDDYLDPLDRQLQQTGATLLAGMLIEEPPLSQHYYNSVIGLGATKGRYDKHHLVPFGEYFPVPAWIRPLLDVLGTPYSDISSAVTDRPPFIVKGQRLGVVICFEDVFADEFRRYSDGAALIVSVTNDAWFGHSIAAAQHLAMARMRSLESGRVTLRASNTGVSAMIGADGNVEAQAGFFKQQILRVSAQPRSGHTPYARWGDQPLWIAGALLVLLAFVRRRP